MPSVDFAAHNLGYWNAAAAARYPDKIAIFDLSRDPRRGDLRRAGIAS